MNLFSKLGSNLIAERIKNEVQKILDEKVSSAVINSLFPVCDPAKASARAEITSHLSLEIKSLVITYTEHTGSDKDASIAIPSQTRVLDLACSVPVRRPKAMEKSHGIQADQVALDFSGTLRGFEFEQMMMGMGATIHAVQFHLLVSGTVSSVWILSTPQDVVPEVCSSQQDS